MCTKGSIDGRVHPKCKTPQCLDGLASGAVYAGIVKRLLYQYKFKPYVADLRNTLSQIFIESIYGNALFNNTRLLQPIVAVVPLSSEKLKKRGYNHAAFLAQDLAKEFLLEYSENLLNRSKHTKPQFKLSRGQRFKNVQNAFDVNYSYKKLLHNKRILLVDDLATSLATLRECARVLKRAGAREVIGITFAREL